jgi:hypothetical protein
LPFAKGFITAGITFCQAGFRRLFPHGSVYGQYYHYAYSVTVDRSLPRRVLPLDDDGGPDDPQ